MGRLPQSSDAGFPRLYRLTEAHEYNTVFSGGRRIVVPGLVLLFRENGLNYDRLGLAVSKKHIKSAVRRNKVKRLVREKFRFSRSSAPCIDIVVVSRAGLGHFDCQQLWQQLNQLWEKLRTHRAC